MKQFFKFMFASMLGFLISIFTLILILVGIVSSIASSAGDDKEVSIKDKSILELNIDYTIPERSSGNLFDNLDFNNMESKKNMGLNEILSCIKKAAEDDKIKGIFLKLSISPNGYGTLEEIRNALIDYKKSKKFLVAYGELVDEHAYYLASVADKIYINPAGELILNGFSSEVFYLKNMFEKIGVNPELIRHGKYKAAGESLIADKMSEENREQIESYVGSIYHHFIESIAKGRKKKTEEVGEIVNKLMIQHPEDAKKLGMIDGLFYNDQLEAELKKLSGTSEKDKLNLVNMGKYKNVAGKHVSTADSKIGVVYCTGDIVSGKGDAQTMGSEKIAEAIRKVRTDDHYKALVMRINSPGGSAMASDVIWREVCLTKKVKPVVVSMGNVAASGGYYIAAPADMIVAEPNTVTGSIGVFGLLFNAKELINNKLGIKIETVNFGEYADMGRADRPLTDAERTIIQKGVDRIYNDFVNKVAEGRKMSKARVDSIAQGRVWSAIDAKRIGLVDELGGIDKAISVAAARAKITAYRTVNLPEQKDQWEELLMSLSDEASMYFTKKQLGEEYKYYEQVKNAMHYQGIQARMMFNVNIE